MRKVLLLAAASVALAAGSPAIAAPIVSTGAVSLVGVTSSTASIGLGTTFTNTLFSVFSSGSGPLAPFNGSIVAQSPVKATNGTLFTFSSGFGSFSGLVAAATATGPLTNRVVKFDATGIFTPVGALAASYAAGPMTVTFSATQTGGTGAAVSASYTLAWTTRTSDVPEPATLALLGAGLLGLGVLHRRRSA